MLTLFQMNRHIRRKKMLSGIHVLYCRYRNHWEHFETQLLSIGKGAHWCLRHWIPTFHFRTAVIAEGGGGGGGFLRITFPEFLSVGLIFIIYILEKNYIVFFRKSWPRSTHALTSNCSWWLIYWPPTHLKLGDMETPCL